MKAGFIVPILLSFVTIGCTTFGGDRIIRVSGRIPILDGLDGYEYCQLNMISSISGARYSYRNVSKDFSITMMAVVGPGSKSYYFVAICDGHKFRSREVVMGGRGSSVKTIDLGFLVEDP